MKQTLLGKSPADYHRGIQRCRAVWIACAVLTVVLNGLFLLLRTDENHTWMLLASILTTVLGGWGLIALHGLVLQPMGALYALACRPAEKIQVTVQTVERGTERVERFDCHRVLTENRVFFLIEGSFDLQPGSCIQLTVASGIVTEVETL